MIAVVTLMSRCRRTLRHTLALAVVGAACSGDSPSDPGVQPAQFGSIVISIGGLPPSVAGNVTVTGPGGFSRTVPNTTTLDRLAAGAYTVSVADVVHEGSTWSGTPGSQTVVVSAGSTITAPPVSYVIASGSLTISASGLPAAAAPALTVTGPEGFVRDLVAGSSLTGLKPGTYTIAAADVQLPTSRYAAIPPTQNVDVVASITPAQVHVTYSLATGSLAVNVVGLPQEAAPAVRVEGPGGFTATVNQETVLENLAPGTYTIIASNVASGAVFVPTPASQQLVVNAGAQPAVANIIYVSTGTSLNVQLVGLPASVHASVLVTGPHGFSRQVTASELMIGVQAGTYTITSASITASCTTFAPQPASQTVTVTPGQSTAATVNYSIAAAGLNLCVDGAYITQSVQSYDNAVPLVAGRNAFLRVFVRGSNDNTAQPAVRVRLFNGEGALTSTMTISAPLPGVPTAVDEASIGFSWNAQLPGSLIQPGLHLLVDVDPSNAIAEADESDNHFPPAGIPLALDVRNVAPLYIRLVPVIQAARGDTARINESNKANFLLPVQRMFPVSTIDADIRQPYLFNGPELQSGGANWTSLLSEMNAIRVAENAGRLYYGVVRVGYSSGVAGLGYVGVPASIGWDHQPSAPDVMAHEMGHNFGRFHAPCGNPSGVDGAYPYTGGTIGVFGYDITTNTMKFPVLRDLMSYCDPHWISDYTYKAILNFRANNPLAPPPAPRVNGRSERGLLVWGRIEQGKVILEPAFEVDAPASLPARGGPHRVDGFGAGGESLFSLSFAGDQVADALDASDQTFAFVVPMASWHGVALSRLRLTARGQQVEYRSAGAGAAPTAQRMASDKVRLNTPAGRVTLVRDASTGQILTIARGGMVEVKTASEELDITVSDGVRSLRSRIRPR